MTACAPARSGLGCDRPARGRVDTIRTDDGVTTPAHTCRQCAEHCELHRYLELREPAPLLVSQSRRRWVLGRSSDGSLPTRETAERIAAELGWTVVDPE